MDGNDLQKKIAGILTTQSNVTVQQLAKRLRVKPHSIRYQLDKLVESQGLEKAILVNQRALGYQVFNLFFNLPASRVKKAVDFLSLRGQVAWLTKNIGPRTYEMTVVARDFTSLATLFRDMGDETGTVPRDVVIAVEGEVTHWGLRFLAETFSKVPIAHFTTSEQIVAVDSLDLEIIKLLRSHNLYDLPPATTKTRISPSTIKYRLEKLRSAGVISEEAYFLRPPMKMFQAQIVLHLKSRAREVEERVSAICSTNPHVECLIAGAGNWDYKILFDAESLPRLLEIEELLLQSLGKAVLRHSLYIRDRILSNRSGL